MLNYSVSNLRLLAISIAVVVAGNAKACGPFLSPSLVTDRHANLIFLPEGDSRFEIGKLLPKKEFEFVANEANDQSASEIAGLSEAQAQALKAMRASAQPEQAYEAGKELPEAIRLYTAGAIAYARAVLPRQSAEEGYTPLSAEKTMAAEGESDDSKFAREKFLAVLSLPDADKKARAVWAAYSLGRMASEEKNLALTTQYFSLARSLAAQNNKDDSGLAVSSYGEEARLYYQFATGQSNLPEGLTQADAFIKATHLYAQQAAYGAPTAYNSLRFTLEHLLSQPPAIAQAMKDSLVQQLVFAYAFSEFFSEEQRLTLLTMLDKEQVENIPNADTVAAFAYRSGRFELAEHFVAKANTPLAQWVNAKLALQKGDQPRALAAYAQAIKAFPADENWSSSLTAESYGYESSGVTPHCLVNTEMGLLQLQRSEYVQALNYLYVGAQEYWMDAAYVAERIVTLDELKTFVDARVPAPSVQELEKIKNTGESTASQNLRNLLARRLMREKRYDEALGYFTDKDTADKARDYVKHLRKTQSLFVSKTFKAEALYKASQLARYNGMEMMGFEGAPDYFVWGGMFEYGTPDDLAKDASVSSGEKARFDASKPKPDFRFHYRFIAADLASQAADLLPPRSQAFAAVLCAADHYLLARYPEQAQPYYLRYLKQGAYVPWGADFGQACPAPEFTRAFFQYPLEKYAQIKRHF